MSFNTLQARQPNCDRPYPPTSNPGNLKPKPKTRLPLNAQVPSFSQAYHRVGAVEDQHLRRQLVAALAIGLTVQEAVALEI
jgi:hypothetical protein